VVVAHAGHAAFQRDKVAAIGRLTGTVLEIGAGRGRNFGFLSPGVTWIGAEPDRRRRAALAAAARRHGHPEPPLDSPAEALPLPGGSVDGVLATAVLCSVTDLEGTLTEIVRVLRPGGRFVFAEHVAAPPGTAKRRVQRLIAPLTRALDHGCDPVRDTEQAVRRSGLQVVHLGRYDLPVLGGVTVPYIVGEAVRPG
jgi:ubiquinone/menaquinone biosynthesis C-methylase UbiE